MSANTDFTVILQRGNPRYEGRSTNKVIMVLVMYLYIYHLHIVHYIDPRVFSVPFKQKIKMAAGQSYIATELESLILVLHSYKMDAEFC